MTFHRVESTNIEDAESELVEDEPNSMYGLGNQIKHESIGVSP
jgi:hypothetical protein